VDLQRLVHDRQPARAAARSPTSFLLREPSEDGRLRTAIQSVSLPSTRRRWRRASRTISA
jgi:hypothetical protein